jgi:hypothetical protein
MATPGAVTRYHPCCSDSPVVARPGVGAQDAIHYLSGVASLKWPLHRWYLGLLRRYLRAVLRGLDYYVTTERDVAPNHCGRVGHV